MTDPDVVYVVHRFPELSETFVIDELDQISARGLRPAVFAIDDPLTPTVDDRPAVRLEPWDGSRGALVKLAMRVALRHPVGIARSIANATTMIRRGRGQLLWQALSAADQLGTARPRRVHAHFANESAAVGWRLAKLLGVPFSFQAHGIDVYTQQFDLETHLGMADVAIAPCEYFAEYLRWVSPGSQVVTIPVGVDPQRFVRSNAWTRAAPPHLVSVGRLVEKKGLGHVLAAVAILKEQGVDTRTTIVGDGPLRTSLEDQARELGVHGDVRFLGAQPRDVVRRELESATLFVLPCVVAGNGDRDSQPVVLKEAMAMEIPVVATSEVGIPELVDDRCGALVPPNDSRALAEAIAGLLTKDDVELRAMGKRGRERINARFSHDITIRALLEAWQSEPAGGDAHA